MMKIWNEAFWKPAPAPAGQPLSRRRMAVLIMPIAALAMLTIGIGLGAEPIVALAVRAAQQLLDPSVYISAVLGG